MNLNKFYTDEYYQQGYGSYRDSYSKQELKYFENCNMILDLCLPRHAKSILDLGCGEGWKLKYFSQKFKVKIFGVDLSDYAINKFNPELIHLFLQDDFYHFLYNTKQIFDVINLTNVIEHVEEPELLLTSIRKVIKSFSTIIVTFPNDGSFLHQKLIQDNKVPLEFYHAKEHLNYWNKDSFTRMVKRLGFEPVKWLADFPIDLFLMNDFSNYVTDKEKGKQAHLSRIEFINLICEQDLEKTANLLLSLGELGLGRNLTVFLEDR